MAIGRTLKESFLKAIRSLEIGSYGLENLNVDLNTLKVKLKTPNGILGWFNAPSFGKIDTANLTTGVGGIGRRHASTDDYVRAIRHGVDPQGKAVFMSSVIAFQYLSDDDLGAMTAYLRAAAPVDRETGGVYLAPLSKILLASGLSAPIPAEVVDHTARRIPPVVAVSADYGKYLLEISGCRDCHGQDLDGGPFPDPTIERIVPNITPGGGLAFWSGEDFITALRTGVTPGGPKKPLATRFGALSSAGRKTHSSTTRPRKCLAVVAS